MAFITTIPVDHATGDVKALYDESERDRGFVTNFTKVFSLRPQVWAGWRALSASVRRTVDARRFELVTLAAARGLRNSYCMLAHGAVLRKQFYSADQVKAIAAGDAGADLEPAEIAMMEFAEKVARDAAAITQSDVQALRDHGFSDPEIFDIAATAAARCFFSKLLDALGAAPDAAYLQMEDGLREQLTVGRAISASADEHVSGQHGSLPG